MSMVAMTTGTRMEEAGCDEQLAARLGRGEAGALEELIARYHLRVRRLAHRLLGWKRDVDDVVQDVFVIALEKANGFRGHSSLWTWLTIITVNLCRTSQRRTRVWQRVVGWLALGRSNEAAVAAADNAALVDERAGEVRAAVAALGSKDREVIVLFYLEQRSTKEIGQLIGASTNAVEVRLHRAREKLRGRLQAFMEGSAGG